MSNTKLDQFPNIYITTLKKSLALGGNETIVAVSSIRTFDGQIISTEDFALLGRGVLSISSESVLQGEFISFTAVDPSDASNPKFTNIVRGLSYKNDASISANKKFHPVGSSVIISFGTHNLRDLERLIETASSNVVTVDSNTGTSGSSLVSTLSIPITTSGNNRGIAVQINTQQSVTVSSVTFNGSGFSQKVSNADATANIRNEQWFLVNPVAGTYSVTITLSASAYVSAIVEALANVSQASPTGATGNSNGSSDAASCSLTNTVTNSVVLDGLCNTSSTAVFYTPGASQSLNGSVSDASDKRQGVSSLQISDTPPATVTSAYAISKVVPWVMTQLEIIPVQAVDMYVAVNSSDTTPSYLDSKIEVVAGDSSMEVTKTIQNPSGNEKISYSLKAVGAMGGGGGVKIAIDTTQHVQNTATTATVYSVPIPLNTLLTNNAIYYKVLVSSLTDSGNKNTTIAVKYGGTTFTTIVIDENTTASKGFIEGVIIANGSTSSQKAQMIATIDKGGTGTGSNWSAYGTGSVDSTVNQDLDIVCTTQSGASITFEAVIVEQISNNGNGTIQPFVLGEPVSVNDYLYESDGTPVTVTSSAYTNDYYVNSSSTFVGQVITPSDPAISQITSASFYANGVGYSGTATAQVYALSGGLPTGSALGTSSPLAYSSGELPFTFSSPVSVTPGTSYAIVLNVSGSTGIIMNVIIQSVDPGIVSTNGGSTWSAPGGNTRYSVTYATSAGKVYKVDLSNPKFGAYKGFAIQSGTAGQTKNVQIGGVLGGFTSLTSGMNVYNDPSTPGGITQTSGISAGRAVGIAVSATQIQLSQMRKRDSGISYSSGTVINQDGFLLCLPNDISGGFSVTETDPLGNAVTLLSGSNGYATGTQVPVTVPVRPGCYYNHDGTFYPLING